MLREKFLSWQTKFNFFSRFQVQCWMLSIRSSRWGASSWPVVFTVVWWVALDVPPLRGQGRAHSMEKRPKLWRPGLGGREGDGNLVFSVDGRYCWWFRFFRRKNKPVDTVGSFSHYLWQVFMHPSWSHSRISEASRVALNVCTWLTMSWSEHFSQCFHLCKVRSPPWNPIPVRRCWCEVRATRTGGS